MQDLKPKIDLVLKQYQPELFLLFAALITSIIAVIMFINGNKTLAKPLIQQNNEETIPTETIKQIRVDIAGAINKPDSYTISADARLKDIIGLSGGLTEIVDKEFFARNFNLAAKLKDQEKIYIPTVADISNGLFKDIQDNGNNKNLINVNTATSDELESLPNIGKTLAQKIIDNRPYQSLEELTEKQVLKKTLFDKLKDLITL